MTSQPWWKTKAITRFHFKDLRSLGGRCFFAFLVPLRETKKGISRNERYEGRGHKDFYKNPQSSDCGL